MSKGKWIVLAVLQGALIVSLLTRHVMLEQRDQILTDRAGICSKYVDLAERTVIIEGNLRRGYADLLERTTTRLGIGKSYHRRLFIDFDKMLVGSLGMGGPIDGGTDE